MIKLILKIYVSLQRIKAVAAPARGGASSCPKEYRPKSNELAQPLDPNWNGGSTKPTHTIVETMMWTLSVRGFKLSTFPWYIYIYIKSVTFDIVVGPGLHCYASALGVLVLFSTEEVTCFLSVFFNIFTVILLYYYYCRCY